MFNPLSEEVIQRTIIAEFDAQPLHLLKDLEKFQGSGCYGLYYVGGSDLYPADEETPVYIGKADYSGSRRGNIDQYVLQNSTKIWSRLKDHKASIEAVSNLEVSDFKYRSLEVSPVFIPVTESLLITDKHPVWNTSLSGFGNKPTKNTRKGTLVSEWDTVHPGRPHTRFYSERDGGERDELIDFIHAHYDREAEKIAA